MDSVHGPVLVFHYTLLYTFKNVITSAFFQKQKKMQIIEISNFNEKINN